ncbi:MAG: ComEC/Rec2 family competence protein [Planctomycetota bacterium]
MKWLPTIPSDIRPFRPAMLLAVAFGTGIIYQGIFPISGAWLFGTSLAAAAGLAALILSGNRGLAAWGAVTALMVLLGAFDRHVVESRRPAGHVVFAAGEGRRRVVLGGILRSDPVEGGRLSRSRQTFDVAAERLDERVVSGDVRVTVYDAGRLPLHAGDRVRVSGFISLPRPPGNPGQFDYRVWLARRGVDVIFSADGAGAVGLVARAAGFPVLRFFDRLADRVEAAMDAALPPDQAAFLKGLLLGERAALDESLNDAFLRTGTIHFLAVSGLHVVLVAAFLRWPLALLRVGEPWSALAVGMLTWGYVFLVGFSPSALRAAVGTSIYLGAGLAGREGDFLSTLAWSALAILVARPLDIGDYGFQLSFLSVLGIVLFSPPIERWLASRGGEAARLREEAAPAWRRFLRRAFRKAVAVTAAACLVTTPLVAAYFHLVSFSVLPGNLVLAPLVAAVMAAGFAGMVVAVVLPAAVAAPFLALAGAGAWLIGEVVRTIAAVPGGSFFTASPPVALLLAWYLLLAWAALRKKIGFSRRIAGAAAVLLVAGGVYAASGRGGDGAFTVTAFDVGKGACVLIRSPGGTRILADCGAQSDPRVGSRVAAPALWASGVSAVDLLILSHADADHVNGVPELLVRIPVKSLVVPPGFGDSALGARILNIALARGVRVATAGAGDVVTVGDAQVRVLHPPKAAEARGRLSANDASLVAEIRTAAGSVLVPGDLQTKGLALAEKNLPSRVSVLVAPHHGENPEVTERLAARAGAVLVSSPRSGDGDDTGAFSTADAGAVTASCRGGVMDIRSFRGGLAARVPYGISSPSPGGGP